MYNTKQFDALNNVHKDDNVSSRHILVMFSYMYLSTPAVLREEIRFFFLIPLYEIHFDIFTIFFFFSYLNQAEKSPYSTCFFGLFPSLVLNFSFFLVQLSQQIFLYQVPRVSGDAVRETIFISFRVEHSLSIFFAASFILQSLNFPQLLHDIQFISKILLCIHFQLNLLLFSLPRITLISS